MNETVDRALALVETLARHPGGVPLVRLADTLGFAAGDAEPLLAALIRCGYVCQVRSEGDYALTTKLSGLGLTFLSRSRVVDVAQPMLERLAEKSGELVRLAIVDGDRLPWMARAHGACGGLRYDPEMGIDAQLSCTATGHAWLLTLSDDEVAARVQQQGLGTPQRFGPNAPATLAELLDAVRQARSRGYALAIETFSAGLSAIAAPVRAKGEPAIGVISVAGPSQRLTEARLHELAPALLQAAAELAAARGASQLLIRPAASASCRPPAAA
jgi:IclR family acetate operon transcriptional repressor